MQQPSLDTVRRITAQLVRVMEMFPKLSEDAQLSGCGYALAWTMKEPDWQMRRPLDTWVYNSEEISTLNRLYMFSRYILSAGFECIGGGYFSAAVVHPDAPGVVFKISPRMDDAYAAYAMWARACPSKHSPVIYHMQRGECGIVFALKEYMALDMARARGYLPPDWSVWAADHRADNDRPNAKYRRTLIKYIREIYKFFEGAAQVDLRDENMMYDVELRRVIITDPVSFTKKE